MKETKDASVNSDLTRMPSGIPYIIGNEAAERFNFYGMRTILVVFMTQYLLGNNGILAPLNDEQAKTQFHLFIFAVYFLPVFGAILSDALWGKYRTIIVLSLVYCAGSLFLALDNTRLGLAIGLTMIAIGSGGIKPCVSACVGDQFGPTNQHLLPKAFSWFYFSINFGSFFSSLLTPWLLEKYGPFAAFGTPAVFMLAATWIFWLGRSRYIHVPAAGKTYIRELLGKEGIGTIIRLTPIYLFIAIFWSLWDQTGSAWVLQADKMDRKVWGVELLSSQIQAVNAILILILIPLFSYGIYPFCEKFFRLTPLRKIGIGLFLTVPSFLLPAWIELQIARGLHPHIGWQFFDYLIITAAEVMVSITSLEFSYTQAPKKMKSLIMSIYLLAIALGNAITAGINYFIQNPDGTSKLTGVEYYLFFSALMFVAAVLFVFVARFYKDTTHLQEETAL